MPLPFSLPFSLPDSLPGDYPLAYEATPESLTDGRRVGSDLAHEQKHVSRGLGRLLQQFQEQDRIGYFLASLLQQIQDVEDAAWSLYVARTLEAAEGALLDQLGEKVGEGRRGRTDDQYRRFIGVRILSNRSDGQIEQLYSIVRQILGGTFTGWIDEHDPASMELQIQEPLSVDTPSSEIDLVLGRSKGGGVSLAVFYTSAALASSLLPDSTVTSFASSGQMPGSTVSATGGVTASVHTV